jgi:hypothetical protein
MESGSLVLAAGALLLAGAVLALLRGLARSRRDLAAARAETSELASRVDALSAQLAEATSAMARRSTSDDTAYVITDAGDTAEPGSAVPDRLVLSATVGEPLVKVVAFGHGVRRALAPETRNRIWFEMRREVRAARRRRRRESRALVREARAAQRADQGEAA